MCGLVDVVNASTIIVVVVVVVVVCPDSKLKYQSFRCIYERRMKLCFSHVIIIIA